MNERGLSLRGRCRGGGVRGLEARGWSGKVRMKRGAESEGYRSRGAKSEGRMKGRGAEPEG
jgi:hypothetical protein